MGIGFLVMFWGRNGPFWGRGWQSGVSGHLAKHGVQVLVSSAPGETHPSGLLLQTEVGKRSSLTFDLSGVWAKWLLI